MKINNDPKPERAPFKAALMRLLSWLYRDADLVLLLVRPGTGHNECHIAFRSGFDPLASFDLAHDTLCFARDSTNAALARAQEETCPPTVH